MPVIGLAKGAMIMSDFRHKIKTVASTKGTSAPEGAKKAGMGCLGLLILIVSILSLIIAIGLFQSSSWILAGFTTVFFLISAATAVLLMVPQKAE